MFSRIAAWSLLLGVAFAGSGLTQDPPLPRQDGAAVSKVNGYKAIPRGGIPKDELPEAAKYFARFAQYYADVVKHPSVYKTPQEFKLEPLGTKHLSLDGPDGILKDLNRFVLEPIPGVTKFGPDNADYIRELGAGLDAALKKVIVTEQDPIVRINATRVLAHVSKSGARAHFDTVTALLADPKTRTEVKYYLFQAAANLLAAGSVEDPKTRNHAVEPKAVGALVKALQDNITNPAMLLAGLPDNKVDAATPEQLAVIGLVRRQAVKALAEVRFVSVVGPDGRTLTNHPVHTLARIAMSDPTLVPAPSPGEAADAAIGICNMAPVGKGYNPDAAVEAITAALITFASPRAASAADRTLPWRSYSIRLAEGLHNWRKLFDPDFDVTQPTKFDATRVPKVIEELYKDVLPKVLAPMEKVDSMGKPDFGAKVDIEGLRSRLNAIRSNEKRNTTLFAGKPETSIIFATPKK